MSTNMSEEEKEIYEEAKKRVHAKNEFYRHLGIYLVVNIGLVLIWAFASDLCFGQLRTSLRTLNWN